MKLIYLTIVILLHYQRCFCKTYDNFILYNTVPTTMDQLRCLKNMETQRYFEVIFWKRPVKLNFDVQLLVNPSDNEIFLERVDHFGLRVEVMIKNIQEAFNNQTLKTYARLLLDKFYWDFYHDLEDIYQWLEDIAGKSTDVDLEVIGKSTQGQNILALVIRSDPAAKKVIVEGGLHGHEWLPIAFVTYLIHQLVNAESSTNGKLKEIANKYNWYLIPIVNPDGFNYTMKEDRLWMKNRKFAEGSYGINLDRNFDYHFGEFGSSKDPNDDYYCGPAPFSELESKSLAAFVQNHSSTLKFYFSYHAYGQKIIIPYSHTLQHIGNYPEMYNYGRQAVGIVRRDFGTHYGLGTHFDTLGTKISGNSAGWVKATFGTQYVFTFVLRDRGSYGFALPNHQIEPSCKEALTALVHIMTTKPKRFRSRYLLQRPLSDNGSEGLRGADAVLVCGVMYWFLCW